MRLHAPASHLNIYHWRRLSVFTFPRIRSEKYESYGTHAAVPTMSWALAGQSEKIYPHDIKNEFCSLNLRSRAPTAQMIKTALLLSWTNNHSKIEVFVINYIAQEFLCHAHMTGDANVGSFTLFFTWQAAVLFNFRFRVFIKWYLCLHCD